jgi:hypothetical protein
MDHLIAELAILTRIPRIPGWHPTEAESCYCSALPLGSGPCVPCYRRWLRLTRPFEESTQVRAYQIAAFVHAVCIALRAVAV